MANKKNSKIKKASYENTNEFEKLIKLILIVKIVFLAFYGITFLVNREKEEEPSKTSASIQYDNILIGNVLTQPNDEYYVMIYDSNDYNKVLYQTYINMYKSTEDAIRVYTADLENPFNKNFVGEKANFKIDDISDLKLTTSTLLKIKKGKIDKYFVGDNLKKHLKEITEVEED